MKRLIQTVIVAAGLFIVGAAVALLGSPATLAQVSDKVRTATASVLIVNSASEPVPVSLADRQTALVFDAVNVSFASLEGLGNIDVSKFERIRVVVENNDFPVDLVVHLIENGEEVGTLGVIEVPGCDGGGCVGTRSITQVYDVPGRTIRFSTLADPRATGSIHIYGR
jgi:hypothetical protein